MPFMLHLHTLIPSSYSANREAHDCLFLHLNYVSLHNTITTIFTHTEIVATKHNIGINSCTKFLYQVVRNTITSIIHGYLIPNRHLFDIMDTIVPSLQYALIVTIILLAHAQCSCFFCSQTSNPQTC